VALIHSDLKEMNINEIEHRLTILNAVYELKQKQNVIIEPDDYVPPGERRCNPLKNA
jgi:hypothetical protein